MRLVWAWCTFVSVLLVLLIEAYALAQEGKCLNKMSLKPL